MLKNTFNNLAKIFLGANVLIIIRKFKLEYSSLNYHKKLLDDQLILVSIILN